MSFIQIRHYSSKKPDPFWRASRIRVRLYVKKIWNERDRKIATLLASGLGVENRLIDQAIP